LELRRSFSTSSGHASSVLIQGASDHDNVAGLALIEAVLVHGSQRGFTFPAMEAAEAVGEDLDAATRLSPVGLPLAR
jgi:hypothetical protein